MSETACFPTGDDANGFVVFRRRHYLGRVVFAGSKWPLWISSSEMAMRDPGGQGGRHRRNWRWSTAPACIAGNGDAAARRARAWWHRRMRRCSSKKKSRLGVRGGDDCRRPGREETARVVAALRDFSRCAQRGAGVPAAAVASPHAPGAAPAAAGGLPRSAPGPRLRRPGA